ncbi:phosphate signaling complex protein PhoU [Haloquadratum walsbyi]|jgi:phosphate uptake regulator, PhoU|uniref:Phosphate-specific transport system accessory protein PhoU n=1 Tax=Haloquadratum walsbyi J07HQW2 TaxID=1238425 RepID=U1PWH3_9EURY|nr:phosphate signaling complex protein PhoU [Haloquadratum walsbyi]ERG96786.1 MAG: phosphate transport system regulatory protein PhoU [Haloquadratum walsbyi J07HQW2]
MTRKSFRESIEELRTSVLDTAELVIDQLTKVLDCLKTGDKTVAQTVIDADDKVNNRCLEIEQDCIDLFALQQPLAGDLRLIAASFKIASDLERIGDLAVNLAEYSLAARRSFDLEITVVSIGHDAIMMLNESLRAYEHDDAEKCQAVVAEDDNIDTLCLRASEALTRSLVEHAHKEEENDGETDVWNIEQILDDVTRLLLTIRDIERIADHAVNISARTLWMINNDSSLIH